MADVNGDVLVFMVDVALVSLGDLVQSVLVLSYRAADVAVITSVQNSSAIYVCHE